MPLVLGIRYPLAGLRARRKPRVELLDQTTLDLRVHLRDCDVLGHVNNGRYLSLMDLGRIDHTGRTGMLDEFRARGWGAVAAGATIRFRRELRWRARYTLRTRVLGWDERFIFWEQVFERVDGSLAARAYAKIALLDGDGRRMDVARALEQLGIEAASPQLPAGVTSWQASEFG